MLAYSKNLCVGLLKQLLCWLTRETFVLAYSKKRNRSIIIILDLKILDDNKKFWRQVKPLFTNKQNVSEKYSYSRKRTKLPQK